ncbi:MAG: succinylglutamate desuccinylase/aspartoacylase family protein [Spirochaetales bacterium]|nr:succinylglutamate desuccinylase/aspartoacylase family protein [Spirochaetales bacterium]MBQ3829722.1 succinylglutamate desuccinylase/aspartoacylase family protein [Spirochaetales bacterium]MBQ4501473.1 succinylglutamate desuccinylase/aspartoacylase family protein [Spirochaetales bacterium]MBQ7728928.1 succinylglutamate desuccinylase/aspartoacylase family protein [Spirochaetales bacterium]MBQ9809825.1 succinylglutamate desuccinylase/aspartoacylase family protein [Spirochaetales bacterium]
MAKKSLIVKIIVLALALVLALLAGIEFWQLRHYKETIVASEDLTEVKWFSDYVPSLKNTWMDTPVFIFDSGVEGGTVFICGCPHPYEPASTMAAYLMIENLKVETGKVIIVPRANYSGSTEGMVGDAYPMFFHVSSDWGISKYRIGDRYTNPLDQWPDPFTYVNYPSGQNLAYQDIRNLNRTYPGRENGTITERAAYAVMEIIRQEHVDIAIDMHEAEILYPVTSTYVAPSKVLDREKFLETGEMEYYEPEKSSLDVAMMAGMNISDQFLMKSASSPNTLHGLSHREWADWSDSLTFLMETPEIFIDKITGPRTEALMTEGKDEFLQKVTDKGLTYFPYDMEFGTPMWYRTGRHLTGALEVIFWASFFYPEMDCQVTWPTYLEMAELEEQGIDSVGYYLKDPDAPENKDRAFTIYYKPVGANYDKYTK